MRLVISSTTSSAVEVSPKRSPVVTGYIAWRAFSRDSILRSINLVFKGFDTEIDFDIINSIILKIELKVIGRYGQKLD